MLVAAMLIAGASAPIEVYFSEVAIGAILRDGAPVAMIQPFVHGPNWQGASRRAVGIEGNTVRVIFDVQGNPVTAALTTQESQGEVRIEVRFRAERNTPIESAHLSVEIDAGNFAGTELQVEGRAVRLPIRETDTLHLHMGGMRRVELPLPTGGPLTFLGGDGVQGLVQDSRRWGGPFELRFHVANGQLEGGREYTQVVTLTSPDTVRVLSAEPYVIRASETWLPLIFPLDVLEGSVLDRSPARVEPAGTHGRVIVNSDGHFAFERQPTVRRRFYGPNLCFSAMFLEPADADRLARRLRMMGYNTVRFHHYDSELTGWEKEGPRSTRILPDQMDRLDYLFAALKREGIYIKIDLFTIRQIRDGEVLPGAIEMDEFKALLLVDDRARANWLEFSQNLLEHTNPYTGLKWKDDPALAWICPVNENNFGSTTISLTEASRPLFDAAFRRAGYEGTFSHETPEGAAFAGQAHLDTFRWMRDQLRAMGVTALLTDVNGWREQRALIRVREELDFVDNHMYWDHPSFLGHAWGLPSRGASGGGIATSSLGGGLQNMALTRLYGKPFTVSEFQFSNPNRHRAESGLFMGAVAASQDWDALWRFAWGHNRDMILAPMPTNYFDMQCDPLLLATDRAFVDLFLREDLAPAPSATVIRFDPDDRPHQNYDARAKSELLNTRLYSSTSQGVSEHDSFALTARAEALAPVRIDRPKGLLTIRTPRTVGAFGPTGEVLDAGPLQVVFTGHRAALWVSSRDGQPLRTSDRMLLTHLTDLQNTDMRFGGPDRQVLEAWGRTPHLVRAGRALVQFDVERAEGLRLYRVDLAGRRLDEIPFRVLPQPPIRVGAENAPVERLEFEVGNEPGMPVTFYYELVRQRT